MISFRKIIAVILAVVTVFSITVTPASATIGDATDYTINTLWDYLVKVASGSGFSVSEWWRQLISSGDADVKYDDYVNDVKTQTGTATVIDGGVRLYFSANSIKGMYGADLPTGAVIQLGDPFGASYSGSYSKHSCVYFDPVTLPYNCNYSYGSSVIVSNFNPVTLPESSFGGGGTAVYLREGSYAYWWITAFDSSLKSFSGRAWIDCIPYTGVLGDYYDIDLSNSTRPTVIVGDVGYYDASNNLQVLNNTTIVNETNSTFFNPVTNVTTNLTNWAYDYSNRSYTLTLDTGDKVSVTYGDEHITIIEGGTTYNVYYVYNTPGGGGPVDPGTSGFFDWWKQQWLDFRAWLAIVLPGGDSTAVPDGALPNLPGETEGDSGFSILDIIKKIVSALWKLVSGFFGTIFGGVFQFFVSLGDNIDGFFSVFDSEDGVFGFGKYGGADIWD